VQSPGNPDANGVNPALHEIEQVRVEQGTDKVLRHNHQAEPFRQTIAAKQQ
jgi:hypothetical protein